jgi:hypothetical protein
MASPNTGGDDFLVQVGYRACDQNTFLQKAPLAGFDRGKTRPNKMTRKVSTLKNVNNMFEMEEKYDVTGVSDGGVEDIWNTPELSKFGNPGHYAEHHL